MYPVQMHAGIKQIYWYSSCLIPTSPWAKPWGTAEATQHYRLNINTRSRTADVGMPSQKSDSQTHPFCVCPSRASRVIPGYGGILLHTGRLHWLSARRAAQECNLLALRAWGLVSMRKIWTYPTLTPGRKKHLRKLSVLVWLIQKPHCLLQCQFNWPYSEFMFMTATRSSLG